MHHVMQCAIIGLTYHWVEYTVQRLYFAGLNFLDFREFDVICENTSTKMLTPASSNSTCTAYLQNFSTKLLKTAIRKNFDL